MILATIRLFCDARPHVGVLALVDSVISGHILQLCEGTQTLWVSFRNSRTCYFTPHLLGPLVYSSDALIATASPTDFAARWLITMPEQLIGTKPKVKQRLAAGSNGSSAGSTPRSPSPGPARSQSPGTARSARAKKSASGSGARKARPRSANAKDGKPQRTALALTEARGATVDEDMAANEAEVVAALLAEAMGSPSQGTTRSSGSNNSSSAKAEPRPAEVEPGLDASVQAVPKKTEAVLEAAERAAILEAGPEAWLPDEANDEEEPTFTMRPKQPSGAADNRERAVFRTSGNAALGLQLIAHPDKPGVFIVSALAAE